MCFVNNYVAKGVSRQQQLFKPQSIDDDLWLKLYAVGEGGQLKKTKTFEKVVLRLVNSAENVAKIERSKIVNFDSQRFSELCISLWKPFEIQEQESKAYSEAKRQERINNNTHSISDMRLSEVWSECKMRLGIEERSELYDAIKSIESRLSCSLGLDENPPYVTLSRLKIVLKHLRAHNVMSEVEGQAGSASQFPA